MDAGRCTERAAKSRFDMAKTLDEIYEEIRDYDLVITNDAALATAINARVDRPVIGQLAQTPRQIATFLSVEILGQGLYSDLRVISSIADETGLDFRYIHGEVENIREIRRYTSDVLKHLHTKSSRAVYNSFEALPTLERAMGAFDPENHHYFKDRRIAVVGLDFFDDLDKHFVPYEYDDIPVFRYGETYEIGTIHEIGNDRQIAENAVDLIDPEKATDYAILINASSPITDAVRSALYRRGIPFVNSLNVRDLTQVRDYLQFLTLSLSYETLRVKHVKELYSNYNGFFRQGREEFLLSKQSDDEMRERARELRDTMAGIRDLTFWDVREVLYPGNNRGRIQIGILLNDLGLWDSKVTSALVSDMVYAVDNVSDLKHSEEIPENEKAGVLIADCRKSMFVDRPVVLYLGMEQDWNVSVVGKQYLDVEYETERNVDRMKVLLQQGSSRLYCVNTTKNGKPARPCMAFDQIMNRKVDGFSDIAQSTVRGRWYAGTEPVMPEKGCLGMDPSGEFSEPFSKSSFNSYYSCPRAYMYGALLSDSEKKSTEFGNLIHAFAELYICYGDLVREKGVDEFVNMISDRYSGLSSPVMEPLDTDRIRVAMCNVMRFIDHLGMGDPPLDTDNSRKKHPNRFMTALGLRMTSSICEVGYTSSKHPIHGNFDLYSDGIVIDYKTGASKSIGDISRSMSLGENSPYPEFQPLIYLALSKEKGGKGEFLLFYAMDNDVRSNDPDFDIRDNIRRVILSDSDIKGCLRDDPGLAYHLDSDLKGKFAGRASEVIGAVSGYGTDDPDTWDKDEAVVSNLLTSVGLNDNKTSRKDAGVALRKLSKLVVNGMIVFGSTITIPRPALDGFLEALDGMHGDAMEGSMSDLPAMPRINCKDCNFFAACTRDVVKLEVDSDATDE